MTERRVISADSHVIEPPEMWREYVEAKMRDRAPHLEHGKDNDFYVIEGIKPMDITVISTAGTPSEVLKTWRRWDAPGRLKGGWLPAERKKDIEADGIDAEVLYGTIALKILPLKDMEYKHACCQAFNRWLADFCKSDPRRYKGIAVLMTDDIDLAVKDLREAKALGLSGAMLGLTPNDKITYGSSEFDPLWAVAQELEMPMSMHNFTQAEGGPVRTRFEQFPSAPVDVQYCSSNLIFSDVFERFPRLKFVSVENDIGWAANFLQRADHVFGRYGPLMNKTFKSGRLPSETFRDHVYLTFMDDPAGIRTYDLIGVDNVMWSNDYPHGDSTWPHSQEAISRQFDKMPTEDRNKLLRGNVIKLYNWH